MLLLTNVVTTPEIPDEKEEADEMSSINLYPATLETFALGSSERSSHRRDGRSAGRHYRSHLSRTASRTGAHLGARRRSIRASIALQENRGVELPLLQSLVLKRFVDVVLASFALVALLPVFAVVAFLVKRDGGPVIYRQRRVGKDGVEFLFYKFRSMVVDADKVRVELEKLNQHGQTGVTFKMKNDPRVTKIGRIIRKTSIDELPQFWNVLKGDMSLVGPRPALPTEVARYTPEQRGRLVVKPGLTCFWQIGGRSELPFEKQVELDIKYIKDRSLWLDLTLLAKTPPALILGSGAY